MDEIEISNITLLLLNRLGECERPQNKSRKKTYSISSYSIFDSIKKLFFPKSSSNPDHRR